MAVWFLIMCIAGLVAWYILRAAGIGGASRSARERWDDDDDEDYDLLMFEWEAEDRAKREAKRRK